MAVYVDHARIRYGRMTMCHMAADSSDELLDMAARIGVQWKWLQRAGTAREHFDVCLAKRALAVAAGAVEVTTRKLIEVQNAQGIHAGSSNSRVLRHEAGGDAR